MCWRNDDDEHVVSAYTAYYLAWDPCVILNTDLKKLWSQPMHLLCWIVMQMAVHTANSACVQYKCEHLSEN